MLHIMSVCGGGHHCYDCLWRTPSIHWKTIPRHIELLSINRRLGCHVMVSTVCPTHPLSLLFGDDTIRLTVQLVPDQEKLSFLRGVLAWDRTQTGDTSGHSQGRRCNGTFHLSPAVRQFLYLVNHFHPFGQIFKGLLLGDVIHEHYSLGASVVGWCDAVEPLLASSVPAWHEWNSILSHCQQDFSDYYQTADWLIWSNVFIYLLKMTIGWCVVNIN